MILALIRRPEGATIHEIADGTKWQAHSIRGFISGTLAKKMGLKIETTKEADGRRAYRVGIVS